ncbi:TrkH family potassium uptake protein [Paenibacillus rhizovicinus]|uniref:TrkH family potassium uptake protein n=1 Tax=Paenibacillus rhizovicinus TaxID=2704463 RepID=A0A6C0PAJ7_9BACL|nr:TrkH family potassium uptake protein [Paenibacillus rhizovicinus]QHW33562.1 TrkH family potassium uptake protein [Paenibacillus rhizovicinus]
MWKSLRKSIEKLSPAQAMTAYYLIAVTLSIGLFSIPAVRRPGVYVSFFDTVFTAVSVVSDTGLGVFNVAETYSEFGYLVIILVLQFGGIGIMAMSTFFWLLIGRRIGLRERRLIMVDNNQFALSGLVKLVIEILRITVAAQIIGAIVLGVRFLRYYDTWEEAAMQGLFASVSATTNAGMDITGQSLVPYAGDYFVQLVTVALIVFGAIGFPVLIEVKTFLTGRRRKLTPPFRFSLFTKLSTSTYFILLAIGTMLIWLFERSYFLIGKSWHASFFYAFFQAATTRSAGLTTMDINEFSIPTLMLMSLFMFIGGSPNSVGGGIRTTTFALNMLFLYNFIRGRRSIKAFKRELHPDDILKSFAISMLAVLMCVSSIVAISVADKQHPLIAVVLEVCSAFGTVGLSTGITPELSPFSQAILMVLMFLGRIGLTSCLFLIGGGLKDPKYRYAVERVITG